MPSGVRIDGSRVTEEADVVIDDSFEDVPLAQLVGIPLKVKRCLVLPSLDEVDGRGGTNDSFGFRSMAKMMADPSTGFPPEPWNKAVGVQAATCQGPWPVLLAVRSDSLPFSPAEWEVLDDWLTTTTTGTWDEEKQRVGVDFGQPHGLLSVKAVNLGPEETYEEFTRKKMAEYGLGSS
eukprot:TRINITY_DN10962_c0_g1_i3.p1 TRINITY_DN10962_c0_g1~~TRINITY_DN10962_c0_g1_i3.p1  ORF type:complete len:178 (+),score=22.73 TRINITY_DN10962_c0_g1_i3:62-595(+)